MSTFSKLLIAGACFSTYMTMIRFGLVERTESAEELDAEAEFESVNSWFLRGLCYFCRLNGLFDHGFVLSLKFYPESIYGSLPAIYFRQNAETFFFWWQSHGHPIYKGLDIGSRRSSEGAPNELRRSSERAPKELRRSSE